LEPGGPVHQIGLSYRPVPARQAGNRFLGSLKGIKIRALDPDLDATLELQAAGKKSSTFVKIDEDGFLLCILDIHCLLFASWVSFVISW
jgi:hypothetical protein